MKQTWQPNPITILEMQGRCISIPAIGANNFELKPQLVSLMQQNCKFHGLSSEDSHQFLVEFLQICDTVKTNRVDPEVYRLMLFPFANLTGLQAASGSAKEASSEGEAYDPENPAIEEVNYMEESYGNTYNPSWRNHPNFSWKDQQNPQQGFNNNNGGRNRFGNSKSFPLSSQQQTENSEQSPSGLANIVSDLSKATLSFMTETRSSIRNLEAQVG
ncbi:hypothetical protein HN873_028986 [Arachis hypogaea]